MKTIFITFALAAASLSAAAQNTTPAGIPVNSPATHAASAPEVSAPPTAKLTPFQQGIAERGSAVQSEMAAIAERQKSNPDFARYVQLEGVLNTLRALFDSPDPVFVKGAVIPAVPAANPPKK